jgi:hypothetical protein
MVDITPQYPCLARPYVTETIRYLCLDCTKYKMGQLVGQCEPYIVSNPDIIIGEPELVIGDG